MINILSFNNSVEIDNSATAESIKDFKVDKKLFSTTKANIEKNTNELANVLDQIDQLCFKRRVLISANNIEFSNIAGLKNLIGISERQLYNEYCKYSFNSDIVKESILAVRKLFLDDTKEIFHNFKCTSIEFDQYTSRYINFTFSSIEPQYTDISVFNNKLFIICIAKHTTKTTNDEYVPNLFYLSCKLNNYYQQTVFSSSDTEVFKTELTKFVSMPNAETYIESTKHKSYTSSIAKISTNLSQIMKSTFNNV